MINDMSLIECPECNESVSDKAFECQYCGCRTKGNQQRLGVFERFPEVSGPSLLNQLGILVGRLWSARIFVIRLAAVCILLFPPETVGGIYSDRGDFKEFEFLVNLGEGSGFLDFSTLFFELLALLLLAIFSYKKACSLKTELKTLGLLYLLAFVIFFPPTQYVGGKLEGYKFIGNVEQTHWIIWVLEIIAVAVTFILVQKKKEK